MVGGGCPSAGRPGSSRTAAPPRPQQGFSAILPGLEAGPESAGRHRSPAWPRFRLGPGLRHRGRSNSEAAVRGPSQSTALQPVTRPRAVTHSAGLGEPRPLPDVWKPLWGGVWALATAQGTLPPAPAIHDFGTGLEVEGPPLWAVGRPLPDPCPSQGMACLPSISVSWTELQGGVCVPTSLSTAGNTGGGQQGPLKEWVNTQALRASSASPFLALLLVVVISQSSLAGMEPRNASHP